MSIYTYKATVIDVLDGDTVRAVVDYGFDQSGRYTLRLWGINAPEMSTPEGKLAKGHLINLLGATPHIYINTIKDRREKYGRYLATLLKPLPDGAFHDLNKQMVQDGHAVEYTP